MARRTWSVMLGAGLVLGCSPAVHVAVGFASPGGTTIDVARFHVTGQATCPPGAAAAIDAYRIDIDSVAPNHVDVRASFRGRRCLARISGWLDVDGNKAKNRGDLVATSPGILLEDRGIGAKFERGPTLTLAPVP